jgi:RND family efflux transporter MFP subunit
MLIAAAFALLVAGCGKKEDAAGAADTTDTAVRLGPGNYVIAGDGRIESGPAISGKLAPREQATIRSQISGAVLATYAEEGGRVGRGALLAQLDDRAIREAVVSAESSVANAENSLALAQRELKRMQTLREAGAIAEREVENSQRNVIAAQAAVAQARSLLSSARKQLTFTRVLAPFSGVVSARLASTGDIVQPGTAIYTLVDPSSMQLEASVPAGDLAAVKVGTEIQFRVTGYPDMTFNGRITRISPTADPSTRQVGVFAEIPNPGSTLYGDLFAEGRVSTESHFGLLVPSSAIDKRMIKPAVLKLDHGVVRKVDVTLGIVDEESSRVEIAKGISAGDTVLIGPAMQITPGTKVRITSPTAAAPAKPAGGKP